MARPLRIEYSGAVYPITSSGNEKKPVRDDTDGMIFPNILQHGIKRRNWLCNAHRVMTGHCHLLIETPYNNLNNRRGRTGHLLQGRSRPAPSGISRWLRKDENAVRKTGIILMASPNKE